MASQMMEKIAQTEQACDRMKENARREAAAILDEAELKTSQMKSQAHDFAREKEKHALEEAKLQTAQMKTRADAEIEKEAQELRERCADKRASAVRQTALYLLELAKGGSSDWQS